MTENKLWLGKNLLERLSKLSEDDLELPVIFEKSSFEKYPLQPVNLSISYVNGFGSTISIQGNILKDKSKLYTDLMDKKKEYDYVLSIYENHIREHFHKYDCHINSFDIRLSSQRYGDKLTLGTYSQLSTESLLSFCKEYGYRMPKIETKKWSNDDIWYDYIFYKYNPRIDTLIKKQMGQ